jgi:hypothetical protein
MTIDDWLASACADADRRGLPGLKPLLSALADATRALRAVDWYELSAQQPGERDAASSTAPPPQPGDGRRR